jgi:hypothetical protein
VTEAKLALEFTRRVRQAGGMAIQLMPTQAGVPDRLVLHEGRMYLVELKTESGRLRPDQVVWHRRAAKRGTTVIVLRGREEVLRWVSTLTSGSP